MFVNRIAQKFMRSEEIIVITLQVLCISCKRSISVVYQIVSSSSTISNSNLPKKFSELTYTLLWVSCGEKFINRMYDVSLLFSIKFM